MTAETQSRRTLARPRLSRVLRLVAVVVLVLLLLPYLVAPLYRFVDPVSTVMVWRWVDRRAGRADVVPFGRMAPSLPRSVIASEDGQFCAHRGIDWRGLREAFDEADDLSEMRGGSTITQQVAKNLFLWQGRSYLRKALELPLAVWIDLVLPKRACWKSISTSPNGARTASSARRRPRAMPSVSPRARAERARGGDAGRNPAQSGRRSARTPGPAVRRLAGVYERRAAAVNVSCISSGP